MMLVAALEHAFHRACDWLDRQLTEAATGFSDHEAGDYLDSTDTATGNPPTAAADPASTDHPQADAGSLDFQELATSQLLSRAADTLGIVAAAFSFLVSDMASPEELEGFTTELRDRAAQFAAHGD